MKKKEECYEKSGDDMDRIQFFRKNVEYFLKWLILGGFVGVAGGCVGGVFAKMVVAASHTYMSNPYMKLFLPIAGLVTVLIYSFSQEKIDKGTDVVIMAVHSDEKIYKKQGILIYVSAILAHFGGASVGKEGAALQIGGSLGTLVADTFNLDEYDRKIMIMAGMSALFGSVFGTPVGAALFPVEVISVGVMYYTALFPCIVASIMGAFCAQCIDAPVSVFRIIGKTGELSPTSILLASLIGVLCAILSVVFTRALKISGETFSKFFPNPYIRVVVGAVIFTFLIYIFSEDYTGSGAVLIEHALFDQVSPYAFLVKMLVTVVVIGAGFKGGEIVPTLSIGACFGAAIGGVIGLDTHFTASLAMLGLFAGMTNCPVSSIFMAIEMFGVKGAPYYGIVVCLSYALSGYRGLYDAQRCMYAKTKPKFINRR